MSGRAATRGLGAPPLNTTFRVRHAHSPDVTSTATKDGHDALCSLSAQGAEMTASVEWAIVAVGAAVSFAALLGFGVARAAAAVDAGLFEFEDAPLVDDLIALAEAPEQRGGLLQGRDDALGRNDFELWRLECGWAA